MPVRFCFVVFGRSDESDAELGFYLMNKPVVCADDFALSENISQGIIRLARAGRVSAISCMTESCRWRQDGALLLPLKRDLSIGLHFNLTEGLHPEDCSLSVCILRAIGGRMDTSHIAKRLNQQLDLFEEVMQCQPHFVDGHQHVHAFPKVRQILFDVLHSRYGNNLPALRYVGGAAPFNIKTMVIHFLQMGFRREAQKQGFFLNNQFSGVYSFSEVGLFKARFRQWWLRSAAESLIMCHPALPNGDKAGSVIDRAREEEYRVLLSDDYAFLEAGITPFVTPLRASAAAKQ